MYTITIRLYSEAIEFVLLIFPPITIFFFLMFVFKSQTPQLCFMDHWRSPGPTPRTTSNHLYLHDQSVCFSTNSRSTDSFTVRRYRKPVHLTPCCAPQLESCDTGKASGAAPGCGTTPGGKCSRNTWRRDSSGQQTCSWGRGEKKQKKQTKEDKFIRTYC